MKANRITAALLACTMALSLTACGQKEAVEEAAPAGVAVQVEKVVSDTVSTDNKVSGKVTADNESTIMIASAAKCTAV